MAEAFFATLECELIDRRTWRTQAEARLSVFRYIEGWYNPHRRHSALGYLSPVNFENQHTEGVMLLRAPRANGAPKTLAGPGSLLLASASGAAEASDSSGGWEQTQNRNA